jgi:cytochrome c-type biogenesis protein CcmH/NrfG
MLVQTNHYSFVLDRLDNESETVFRAVVQRLRQRLDHNPQQVHQLDVLVPAVRLEVTRDELELNRRGM